MTNEIRELWIEQFSEHGFLKDQLYNMSTSDFYQFANAFIKDGTIPPLPPNHNKLDKMTRIAIQCAIFQTRLRMIQLREEKMLNRKKELENIPKTEVQEQDLAYEKVLQDHLKAEADQAKKNDEEKEIEEKPQNKKAQKEQIIEEFEKMGKEPTNGFRIAVKLPNNKRVVRRFTADMFGKDLYTWINAQEGMFDEQQSELIEYILKNTSSPIEPEKTLKDQNITSNTLLICET